MVESRIRKPKKKDQDAEAFFKEKKAKFTWITAQAHFISNQVGVHIPKPSRGYATWLFLRGCITAGSLIRLFELQTANDALYLDHASIAALSRALIENMAVLVYFTNDDLSPDEWECRKDVIYLHDNINRGQFLTGLDPNQKGPPDHILQDLRARLENNLAFQALPPAKRKNLLNELLPVRWTPG
jgi:hypothetical protein